MLENSPPDRASEATGLSIVVFRIFSAVGSQVVAFVLAASALPAREGVRAYPTQAGYTALFVAVTVTGLLITELAARGAGCRSFAVGAVPAGQDRVFFASIKSQGRIAARAA